MWLVPPRKARKTSQPSGTYGAGTEQSYRMYRSGQAREQLMIKDIMVHLDGSAEDEIRLAYAEIIASTWGAHLTAILTNRLPDLAVATPVDGGAAMMQMISEWQNQAP